MQGLHVRRKKVEKARKQQLVKHFSSIFNDARVVVVVHYSGLTVLQMEDLRAKMSEVKGGAVKVTQNRLVKRALMDSSIESVGDLFKGPVAVVYSDDPVVAPKIAYDFAEENENLVILGGVMGNNILDENAMKHLASLPSLDVLRGQMVGFFRAPAMKIASVTQASACQLARVFSAYVTQGDVA